LFAACIARFYGVLERFSRSFSNWNWISKWNKAAKGPRFIGLALGGGAAGAADVIILTQGVKTLAISSPGKERIFPYF
jgi:hypothetical protein